MRYLYLCHTAHYRVYRMGSDASMMRAISEQCFTAEMAGPLVWQAAEAEAATR